MCKTVLQQAKQKVGQETHKADACWKRPFQELKWRWRLQLCRVLFLVLKSILEGFQDLTQFIANKSISYVT